MSSRLANNVRAAGRVWLTVFAIAVQTTSASTYYVDALEGDDSADGRAPTPQLTSGPWRTLDRANSHDFDPGDDLMLRRGRAYTNDGLVVQHGGSAVDPVIISSYGDGPPPRIDGTAHERHGIAIDNVGPAHILIEAIAVRNISGGQSISVTGSDHVTLRNLELVNNTTRNGILVTRSQDVLIEHVTIRNVKNSGIALIGSSSDAVANVTVRDCLISGVIDNDGITIHRDSSDDDAGTNFVFTGNYTENCAEQGYDITSGTDVLLVDNTSSNCADSSLLISQGASRVTVLFHESIADSHDAGAAIIISAPEVTVAYSTFRGEAYRHASIDGNGPVALLNNLFIVPDRMRFPIDIRAAAGVTFVNNIVTSPHNAMSRAIRFFATNAVPGRIDHLVDHNLYDGVDAIDSRLMYIAVDNQLLTLDPFRSLYGKERNGRIADPMFAVPPTEDTLLKASSPGIDAGMMVTNLPAGPGLDALPLPMDGNGDGLIAPDIGPVEHAYRPVDSDGDSMLDADELRAGTAPDDPTSYLAIREVRMLDSGHVQLGWIASTGVPYVIRARAAGSSSGDIVRSGLLATTNYMVTDVLPPAGNAIVFDVGVE